MTDDKPRGANCIIDLGHFDALDRRDDKRNLPPKRLTLNSARCITCDQILVSKHRHDWVSCKGDHIFIDGGLAYQRAGGDFTVFQDLSTHE
jgi:hypothetical protein